MMKRTPMKRSGPIKAKAPTAKRKAPAPKGKGLKTKQRAVTPLEKAMWDRLAGLGCIACMKDGMYNPHVSIHHVDGRTKPGCHLLVLPLCGPHHQRDDTDPLRRIAVHPDQGRFEKRYGQQLALVAECMAMLEGRA